MTIHSNGPPPRNDLIFPYLQTVPEEECFGKDTMPRIKHARITQEQSTDDHHTDLIPIPSIKHPTSFAVNYKNDSNRMVERDDSIVCQQNSKEPETKKQNNHNS